ncbi:UBX domain-containing protein 4 [Drosophila tropicalis]|uniref:UBX domain-containing protein 4 n=1 Tax=Drosophila tropicalis TaxID=46794 RepID=UPI0035AB9858
MNWHSGNIAEAVAESKVKDAIFVVYIEGQDEMSAKLEKFLNDGRVRAKLESSDFVAIKVKGDSSAYGQFISLYKVVPIPSIFFIGKSGTPLEIATGITTNVEELVDKIEKVLVLAGKRQQKKETSGEISNLSNVPVENADRKIAGADDDDKNTNNEEEKATTSATSAILASEMAHVKPTSEVTTSSVEEVKQPLTASYNETTPPAPAALAAEKRAAAAAAAKAESVDSPPAVGPASNLILNVVPTVAAAVPQGQQGETEYESRMLADAQNILAEKRRERLAQEQKREKENELRRRREGKEAQNQQALSKEQEIRNMQERIRRERQEEQEARERIRAQIAADRAEMTRRVIISADTNSSSTGGSSEGAATTSGSSVDETRLQIRLPGGVHRTKSFPSGELLSTVKIYVHKELLAGSNIQDFTLATSYPRREFQTEDESKTLTELNLVPNALVLVLTKEQVNRVVRTGGSIMTILATVFWALLTPVAKAFDYINKMGIQRLTQRLANIGWLRPLPQQQAAGDDVVLVPGNTASARRNMDIFLLRPAQNPGNQQPQLSPSPSSPPSVSTADVLTPDQKENAATPPTGNTTKQLQAATSEAASVSAAAQTQTQSHQFQQRPGGYQPPRYGDANIRRLQDTKKDDKDNKATYNGNSTQQQ